VEWATIAFSKEPQTVEKTLNGEDAKKCEIAIKKNTNLLLSTTFGP
jgi:hypothetical protein